MVPCKDCSLQKSHKSCCRSRDLLSFCSCVARTQVQQFSISLETSLNIVRPATEMAALMALRPDESESHSVVSDSTTPWTIDSMEFSRPEYWPFPTPGDFPIPRIEPRYPALQADSLPAEPLLLLLSRFSRDQLCNPMDSSPPDSSA